MKIQKKGIYIFKALFESCIKVTPGTNLTLNEFWKHRFHIFVRLRSLIWHERVSAKQRISPCKKLWSYSVVKRDSKGFEQVSGRLVIDKIVFPVKIMELEVDSKYIDELVKEHRQEFTTKELMGLHSVSQQEAVEEILSWEGEITVS